MVWKIGTAAVAAATALMLTAAPPAMARDNHRGGHHGGYHHGGYNHRGHQGGNFGAGIAGFAAGAILGGALASQPRYDEPSYAYAPGQSVRWCMQHYRSYNPRSGTYLGYDGYRHSCP